MNDNQANAEPLVTAQIGDILSMIQSGVYMDGDASGTTFTAIGTDRKVYSVRCTNDVYFGGPDAVTLDGTKHRNAVRYFANILVENPGLKFIAAPPPVEERRRLRLRLFNAPSNQPICRENAGRGRSGVSLQVEQIEPPALDPNKEYASWPEQWMVHFTSENDGQAVSYATVYDHNPFDRLAATGQVANP